MKWQSFFLALLLASSSWGQSGYFLTEQQKADILQTLSEARKTSDELKQKLNVSIEKLQELEKKLVQVENLLKQSEETALRLSEDLRAAIKDLNESKKSFEDYQQSEFLRWIGWCLLALAGGILGGHYLWPQ